MDERTSRDKINADFPKIVDFLKGLVTIPAISALPQYEADVVKSAEFIVGRLAGAGFEAKITTVQDPKVGRISRPAIIGEKPGPAGTPTVLLCAHHDMMPADGQSGWNTSPFVPVEKDGRLYGRGTSDDGAGIAVHLATLRAWGENLPMTVKLSIEGEEGVGSPTFHAFLEKYRDFMESDVIIVTDSPNWDTQTPVLTIGLRGVLIVDMTVHTLTHAVHSGQFGGVVLDALTSLCRLTATLHTDTGVVAVPGLMRDLSADVDYPEADLREQLGAVDELKLVGEDDLTARLWTQPTVTVIGIDCPDVEHSGNALLPEATARISMWMTPGENPQQAGAALTDYFQAHVPFGAEVTVNVRGYGPTYAADLETPTMKLMQGALTDAFDQSTVHIGMGGSIPFIATFQELFPHAQILVTGVEDSLSQAYSEDGSQDLTASQAVALVETLFLGRLAAAGLR